jgi:hypothetical protein
MAAKKKTSRPFPHKTKKWNDAYERLGRLLEKHKDVKGNIFEVPEVARALKAYEAL